MSRWWSGRNPAKTKKERKRDKAEVTHECSICLGKHPTVRKYHGIYIKQFQQMNTPEAVLNYGMSIRQRYWDMLIDFEADIDRFDQRARAFDETMSRSR